MYYHLKTHYSTCTASLKLPLEHMYCHLKTPIRYKYYHLPPSFTYVLLLSIF